MATINNDDPEMQESVNLQVTASSEEVEVITTSEVLGGGPSASLVSQDTIPPTSSDADKSEPNREADKEPQLPPIQDAPPLTTSEDVDGSEPNTGSDDQPRPSQPPSQPQPRRPKIYDDVFDDFSLQTIGNSFFEPGSDKEIRIYEQPNNNQFILEKTITEEPQAIADEEDPQRQQEEDDDAIISSNGGPQKFHGITIKQTNDESYSLSFLRASYGLIAVFMGGFIFILAICILLFLFIDLATQWGVTENQEQKLGPFFATFLSIPIFVYTATIAMTFVTRFVVDTFNGHPFLRSFGLGVVTTDWTAFVMYLGIPLLTFIITLFAEKDNWWEISLLTWFSSVLIFFGFFSFCVLWFELNECLQLMKDTDNDAKNDEDRWQEMTGLGVDDELPPPHDAEWEQKMRFWTKKARRAVVYTMGIRLSGKKSVLHKVRNMTDGKVIEDKARPCFSERPVSFMANRGWIGCPVPNLSANRGANERYVKWLSFCIQLNNPKRVYTIKQALGIDSYVTKDSWSLEKLFCRRGGIESATIITYGPSSITEAQIESNVYCKIIGSSMIILLLLGLAVWFIRPGQYDNLTGGIAIFIITLLIILVVSARTMFRLRSIRRDVIRGNGGSTNSISSWIWSWFDKEREEGEDEDPAEMNYTTYRYWEVEQISRPKVFFTLGIIGIEIGIFFIFPLVYLYLSENTSQANFFLFLGLVAGLRHYLNPSIILREHEDYFRKIDLTSGSSQSVERNEERNWRKEWKKKSRTYNITSLNADSSRNFWMTTFLLIVVFFVLVAVAAGLDAQDGEISDGYKKDTMTLVNGFEYKTQPNLPYPTCQLNKGFDVVSAELGDFAFLAALGYVFPNETQPLLNEWFGDNVATFNQSLIDEFYAHSVEYDSDTSPVSYKPITADFTAGKSAMVTIRGTSTIWDIMADAQLWLAAMLFQALREVLPLGKVFTPILHHLVTIVNHLESRNIAKVAFYRETTAFVKYLQEKDYSVQVTGHSLGGGLALITGAQAHVSAVGISAPNAMLSRDSFIEPITVEELDTYTFNVVPDLDIVPKFDDKARLYQQIDCRVSPNEFGACHFNIRSLCEIQYTCGTANRPVLCQCHFEFGYQLPEPTTNTTNQTNFTQACVDANYKFK